MVEESPEVLHEGMTSKKRFLDELSLPSSILLHISIYIYYFLPFRELKPNHFISSLEKKKKKKKIKSKSNPIVAVVIIYIPINAFSPVTLN